MSLHDGISPLWLSVSPPQPAIIDLSADAGNPLGAGRRALVEG